jgi:hypothetical protein
VAVSLPTKGDRLPGRPCTWDLILKRKSPAQQRALPQQGEPNSAGPTDSHPSWRPPAMGVLSEIDGCALCYPAFPQLALIHEWHKDGVNRRSSCCAAASGWLDGWTRHFISCG